MSKVFGSGSKMSTSKVYYEFEFLTIFHVQVFMAKGVHDDLVRSVITSKLKPQLVF